jgi:hypothetical protein
MILSITHSLHHALVPREPMVAGLKQSINFTSVIFAICQAMHTNLFISIGLIVIVALQFLCSVLYWVIVKCYYLRTLYLHVRIDLSIPKKNPTIPSA